MSTVKFGDVPVGDYLRMVRKTRRWRLTRAILLPAACILAFTAGSLAPWAGKGSSQLTLGESLALVDAVPLAEWEHELAVTAVARHVGVALSKLTEVAARGSDSEGKAGVYAAVALKNAAVRSIKGLRELAATGTRAEASAYLDMIKVIANNE